MIPYELSKDYSLLKELLDEGKEIVCFADYNSTVGIYRDICIARCHTIDKFYDVICRGIEYTSWNDWYSYDNPEYTFEKSMEEYNVEFIVPTK